MDAQKPIERNAHATEGIPLGRLVAFALVGIAFVSAMVYWIKAPVQLRFQESPHDAVVGAQFPRFDDEPEARNLYTQMLTAYSSATTLSYKVESRSFIRDRYTRSGASRPFNIYLRKPHDIRIETRDFGSARVASVLVGGPEYVSMYWPAGRGRLPTGYQDQDYDNTQANVYLQDTFTDGSLARFMGIAFCRPLISPRLFFNPAGIPGGNPQAVRWVGEETLSGDPCDVIETSSLEGQHSYLYWVARADHLPRRVKKVSRVCDVIMRYHTYYDVCVNDELSPDLFQWTPPAGWHVLTPTRIALPLVRPGEPAPNFVLRTLDDDVVRLTDFQGSVLWLNFWHIGRPWCVEQGKQLQELHTKYGHKGLAILGFNWHVQPQHLKEVMERASITYPTICDVSEYAETIAERYGAAGASETFPTNVIIDRQGVVVAAWRGYVEGDDRHVKPLEALGFSDIGRR